MVQLFVRTPGVPLIYSGEKATGHASGADGGSTPIVLPRWRLPPCHGGAAGRLRRPGGAGATGGDGLSRASRCRACHAARVPRRRGRVPCGGTEGEVGETPGMPAGQAGGAGMVEGGACPDHARVCPRIAPRRGAGDVVGRPGAGARPCRARGTMSGGPLRAGTGRRGRGATTRAPSVPVSRPPGRRGNAAVVTGPYGALLKPPGAPQCH